VQLRVACPPLICVRTCVCRCVHVHVHTCVHAHPYTDRVMCRLTAGYIVSNGLLRNFIFVLTSYRVLTQT